MLRATEWLYLLLHSILLLVKLRLVQLLRLFARKRQKEFNTELEQKVFLQSIQILLSLTRL